MVDFHSKINLDLFKKNSNVVVLYCNTIQVLWWKNWETCKLHTLHIIKTPKYIIVLYIIK